MRLRSVAGHRGLTPLARGIQAMADGDLTVVP